MSSFVWIYTVCLSLFLIGQNIILKTFKCKIIHVINFKEASGRFFFQFLEVFEKCLEYKGILHSFQGDFKILVKSEIF